MTPISEIAEQVGNDGVLWSAMTLIGVRAWAVARQKTLINVCRPVDLGACDAGALRTKTEVWLYKAVVFWTGWAKKPWRQA